MKNLHLPILISIVLLNIVCSAQTLKIDSFSLKVNGEAEIISLSKSGEVSIDQQVIWRLSADGRLADLSGKTIVALSSFGLVTDADDVSYAIIDKNGSLSVATGSSLGWTQDGKFKISKTEFLTISSNKKNLYRTASFLIFLKFWIKQSFSPPTESELVDSTRLKYKDTDIVMSIETGTCEGSCDSLLLIYGNGKITYRGSRYSRAGMTVVGQTTRTKINQLLQTIDKINFPSLPLTPAMPHVDDGSSTTTLVWSKGKLIKTGCEVGEPCPEEAIAFRRFFDRLFAEELAKLTK
jgi:hypothetical protein